MSWRYAQGDIFESGCEALVNPVNCVGVMGAGLAKQFRDRFLDYHADYMLKCRRFQIKVGHLDEYEVPVPVGKMPHYIFSAPTKKHFRDKSHPSTVFLLIGQCIGAARKLDLNSLAIPALGCGCGGLDWAEMKPKITEVMNNHPVSTPDILIYEPFD